MNSSRHEERELIFPVMDDIVLINDFIIRRDTMEALPIPLALSQEGQWLWHNAIARRLAEAGILAGWPSPAEQSSDSQETIHTQVRPVTNLEGRVVGQLAWVAELGLEVALDPVTMALVVASSGVVVWANQAGRKFLGASVGSHWNDLFAGIPPWETLQGTTTLSWKEFEIEIFRHDRWAVIQARRRPQDPMMSMERVAEFVHEIRNPLAALSGYVELAQIESEGPPAHYYDRMMQEIDRLTRLTSELLTVSRDIEVHPTWADLEEAVEIAWFSASRGYRSDAPALQLEKHYAEDTKIWADPDRLRQVLGNLMRNAVEAMASKGTKIVVRVKDDQDHTLLQVSDDGPGLPSEVQGKLFLSRTSTKSGGNGLGLLIVQGIMRAHGGSVWAHSEAGTTFDLSFPKPH